MNDDTVCTLCGREGHRASHCPHNSDAQIARAPWPFGEGYVSQLEMGGIKSDPRGAHTREGKHGPAMSVRDSAKFAPKRPKAGKPIPGHRAPKGAK